MNLVGKIFVFLVFCMSLVFMSFTVLVYATHKNWKDEVLRTEAPPGGTLGWKKRLENAQLEKDRLDSQKRDLEDELASERALRRQVVAKLEAEKQRLVAAEVAARGEYTALVVAHKAALTAVENAQNRLTILRTESDSMRKEISLARASVDDKYGKLLVVQEKKHMAEGEVARLGKRHEMLVSQLQKAKEVLDANDLTPDTPTDKTEPPLDGIVTRVAKTNDDIFVEVTVGSDDGLQQGHTMEVFRGPKWLGQINIVRTTPDRAVGKVNRRTQQGEIQARDRVETRRSLRLTAG